VAEPRPVWGRAGIYVRLLGAVLRAQASYRASFALDLAANSLIPLVDLATIFAVFHVTRTLGGFTAAQVVVIYGLALSSFSLADLGVGNIEKIRLYVRQGLLDAVLVRPMSVLGQLLAVDFAPRRFVRVVTSGVVLVLAVNHAGIAWTGRHVALIVSTVVCGAVIFSSVFVASATVAFFWIDSGEFANAVTYGGRDFTEYPVTVYGGAFRVVFAYGLGAAFVAYVPAVALFGHPELTAGNPGQVRGGPAEPLVTGLPTWVGWGGGPLVAAVALIVAGLVWRTGVRHYRSTGS
jgi:ABC-2 type transport system permease protein